MFNVPTAIFYNQVKAQYKYYSIDNSALRVKLVFSEIKALFICKNKILYKMEVKNFNV